MIQVSLFTFENIFPYMNLEKRKRSILRKLFRDVTMIIARALRLSLGLM